MNTSRDGSPTNMSFSTAPGGDREGPREAETAFSLSLCYHPACALGSDCREPVQGFGRTARVVIGERVKPPSINESWLFKNRLRVKELRTIYRDGFEGGVITDYETDERFFGLALVHLVRGGLDLVAFARDCAPHYYEAHGREHFVEMANAFKLGLRKPPKPLKADEIARELGVTPETRKWLKLCTIGDGRSPEQVRPIGPLSRPRRSGTAAPSSARHPTSRIA